MLERRVSIERRLGERRYEIRRVPRERRDGASRRRPFDRRESASGHIRNAIQALEGVGVAVESDRDHASALRTAIERLWLALREVDRLVAAHRHVARQVRRRENRGDPGSSWN